MEQQSTALGALLAGNGVSPGAAVLDCACGIGTQALGLAGIGYRVSCSDPSRGSVAELSREAARRHLEVTAGVCSFADLSGRYADPFSAVIACDNAVPHLLTAQAVREAARQMHAVLRQGGVLVISTRDYDTLREERPSTTAIVSHEDAAGARVHFQLWSWHADEPVYDFKLFLLTRPHRAWTTVSMTGRYRAWTRAELAELFRDAGFSRCAWLTPEESGFFQPVMIARKGEE